MVVVVVVARPIGDAQFRGEAREVVGSSKVLQSPSLVEVGFLGCH